MVFIIALLTLKKSGSWNARLALSKTVQITVLDLSICKVNISKTIITHFCSTPICLLYIINNRLLLSLHS